MINNRMLDMCGAIIISAPGVILCYLGNWYEISIYIARVIYTLAKNTHTHIYI